MGMDCTGISWAFHWQNSMAIHKQQWILIDICQFSIFGLNIININGPNGFGLNIIHIINIINIININGYLENYPGLKKNSPKSCQSMTLQI
jgi:hypothetical protein